MINNSGECSLSLPKVLERWSTLFCILMVVIIYYYPKINVGVLTFVISSVGKIAYPTQLTSYTLSSIFQLKVIDLNFYFSSNLFTTIYITTIYTSLAPSSVSLTPLQTAYVFQNDLSTALFDQLEVLCVDVSEHFNHLRTSKSRRSRH